MADLAELPAKFYSVGFQQESQGEGKDLEWWSDDVMGDVWWVMDDEAMER